MARPYDSGANIHPLETRRPLTFIATIEKTST
jgi:hypothetical protein